MTDGVRVAVVDGVGTITFASEKRNALPATVLRALAEAVDRLAADAAARVVVLASAGDGPFCAGASFDELVAVGSVEAGTEFFLGFARVILALRACPKPVIARVQGPAVGGGVGLIAACDLAHATALARIRLSELALGFGPFVIGPAVERRLGTAAFTELALGADWRDAAWAAQRGLYAGVHADIAQLDAAVTREAARLAASSPQAMARLKAVLWQGTEDWPRLLPERARISGELLRTEPARAAVAAAKRG